MPRATESVRISLSGSPARSGNDYFRHLPKSLQVQTRLVARARCRSATASTVALVTRALTLWGVPAVVAAAQTHAHRHSAPASSSGSDAFPAVFGFGIVVAIVIGVIVLIRTASRSSRPTAQQQSAMVEHMKALAYQPIPPIGTPAGLNLDTDERAYYSSAADVLGSHTTTRRVGGSTGPSFRIAKGVYWRASAFSSQPIRQNYVAVDDSGTLTVTNKRVIFVGHKQNLALPIAKILSTEPYSDGFMLNPTHGRSTTFRNGNQDAWFILERARLGSLDQLIQAPAAPTP